jgi:hypothetical protein
MIKCFLFARLISETKHLIHESITHIFLKFMFKTKRDIVKQNIKIKIGHRILKSLNLINQTTIIY